MDSTAMNAAGRKAAFVDEAVEAVMYDIECDEEFLKNRLYDYFEAMPAREIRNFLKGQAVAA